MVTDMTTGTPKPPLRMMAPRGAPIKKKNRQANESVNFLCHSTQCVRVDWSISFEIKPRNSYSLVATVLFCMAFRKILCCWLTVSWLYKVSKFNVCRAILAESCEAVFTFLR